MNLKLAMGVSGLLCTSMFNESLGLATLNRFAWTWRSSSRADVVLLSKARHEKKRRQNNWFQIRCCKQSSDISLEALIQNTVV